MGPLVRSLLLAVAIIATACSSPEPLIEAEPETPVEQETESADIVDFTAPEVPESTEATEPDDACRSDVLFPAARTDVRIDGNRVAAGGLDFGASPQARVALPGEAEWVVPDPAEPNGWYVSLIDGTAVRVDGSGVVSNAGDAPVGPPELAADGTVISAFANHGLFTDPLPDGRVVSAGDVAVVLAGPTGLYGHGVLGDSIEASAIEFVDLCTGERGRIEIAPPDVIEGVAPMLADVDGDSELEIVVTLANGSVGARLAVYEFNGMRLAESEPIGTGNRWRNQLAAGPFGPDGQIEVVDVRTPHIGGTVQAFALDFTGDVPTLERVAASDNEYTSHVIRSGNLDMALAIDANLDGRLDALVPTSDRGALVALTRTTEADGWAAVAEVALDSVLTSNLATQTVDGRTTVAAASSNVLLVVG